VKPKPLDQLTYFYNDYINLSDDEKKSIKMTEQSNKIRLEAIMQHALEKKGEKDKITRALRKNDGSTNCKLADIADIGTIFEGESGRERLNLQKKFRCDDRFKMTSDFVSDDEILIPMKIISCKMVI
ncbi:hypothetical protein C2G38_2054788, partial [Gigaspora rosea]